MRDGFLRRVPIGVAAALVLLENVAGDCLCPEKGVCSHFADADIVVHGRALTETKFEEDGWTTLQYTVGSPKDLEDAWIYKYPAVRQMTPEEIKFTTPGGPDDCGVQLEIGEEYLIGLYQSSLLQLTASSCGLFKKWDDVTDEEKKLLTADCDECGVCGEFQECKSYTTLDGIEQPYCADACAPGKCDEDKTCILEEVQCVTAPCPPIARCSAFDYVGCFKDDPEDRVLGSQYDLETMDNEICYEHCKAEGAAYFATQYGYECWCYVSGRADFDRHGGGAVCDMPCKGDEGETCGGEYAFSLHKLEWPKAPSSSREYLDCYRDVEDDRLLTEKIVLSDMTPAVCREHCVKSLGDDANYYATQYGSECWCSTTNKISDLNRHGEGVCHMPCAGDEEIACGGNFAFSLFKFKPDP